MVIIFYITCHIGISGTAFKLKRLPLFPKVHFVKHYIKLPIISWKFSLKYWGEGREKYLEVITFSILLFIGMQLLKLYERIFYHSGNETVHKWNLV